MQGHSSERVVEMPADEGGDEDRGAVVVGLSAAAISGFSMGLVIHGEGAMAGAIALLVPTIGFAGWWFRGAWPPHRRRTRR